MSKSVFSAQKLARNIAVWVLKYLCDEHFDGRKASSHLLLPRI